MAHFRLNGYFHRMAEPNDPAPALSFTPPLFLRRQVVNATDDKRHRDRRHQQANEVAATAESGVFFGRVVGIVGEWQAEQYSGAQQMCQEPAVPFATPVQPRRPHHKQVKLRNNQNLPQP